MKKHSKNKGVGVLIICLWSLSLSGQSNDTAWENSLKKLDEIPGKINLDSRIRYEVFDLEGGPELGGFSHRIRYGYTTPDFNGFTAMAEGETLYGEESEIHPLDAAGTGTELNQLWIAYSNKDWGLLKLGRQIYTLDDHRFIGHVGWRQNIQTFEAITGSFKAMEKLSLQGFYIDKVNRVNGTDEELDGYGANVSFSASEFLNVTGFYYSLGFETKAAWSSDTYGVRLTGSTHISEIGLKYAFSYALQTDNSDSGLAEFELDYFAGDVSTVISGFTLGLGAEILEGDGINGFKTPLATVHKFAGFADVFLPIAGIPNGLEDYYVYAGYKIPIGEKSIGITAIYHWFEPENGSGSYGEEIDLVASYAFNKYISIMLKYGDYSADAAAVAFTADKKMFTVDLNLKY